MLSWIAAPPIVNATPTISPRINRIAHTPCWWLVTTVRPRPPPYPPPHGGRVGREPQASHTQKVSPRPIIPDCAWREDVRSFRLDPAMRWKYENKERFKAPDLSGPRPCSATSRTKGQISTPSAAANPTGSGPNGGSRSHKHHSKSAGRPSPNPRRANHDAIRHAIRRATRPKRMSERAPPYREQLRQRRQEKACGTCVSPHFAPD